MDFVNLRLRIECRQREVLFGGEGREESLFQRVFCHQDVDIDRVLLAHAVGACNALFQHGGVPRQIDVDDRVGRLQVKSRRSGVRREEQLAVGIGLEFMHQRLTLLLRDGAIQPHERQLVLLEDRLDQVEHRRPFREDKRLATVLFKQPFDQVVDHGELARKAGPLLVDEDRAVGRHATEEQLLLEHDEVHLGQKLFVRDATDLLEMCDRHLSLLGRRRDADDLVGARGKLLLDRDARATEQDRREVLTQLGEVFVAEDFASFIDDAVIVEEAEAGTESPVVDELHDRVQLIKSVFERRSAESQRESRPQSLDDAARLGLPIFDPLPFVDDDQIPSDSLDIEDVAQDLFVVADREERFAPVLRATFG